MQSREADRPHASATSHAGQTVFYKMDLAKLTFREIRNRASSHFAFLLGALTKILRLPQRLQYGFAPESASILELREVPRHVVQACDAAARQCEEQHFVRRFATTCPVIGDQEGYNIVLANRERTVLAVVAFARLGQAKNVSIGLFSILANGPVFSTTNARPATDAPPGFEPVRHLGATPAQLVKWHAQRLREIQIARPLELDEVGQRQLCLDILQRVFEFNRSRGVWAPVRPEEAERLRLETRSAT